MAKFLIEVPHSEDKYECIKAIQIFLSSGNHFLAKADWGCSDGEHKAWMIVDVDNKDQARQILPSLYRRDAKIVKLQKYQHQDMEEGLEYHI